MKPYEERLQDEVKATVALANDGLGSQREATPPRYFVNLSRRHKKSIEVTEREWRRISAALVAGHSNQRIVVHEEITGGTRTHFLAHAEIHSLEERTGASDGWDHLDDGGNV